MLLMWTTTMIDRAPTRFHKEYRLSRTTARHKNNHAIRQFNQVAQRHATLKALLREFHHANELVCGMDTVGLKGPVILCANSRWGAIASPTSPGLLHFVPVTETALRLQRRPLLRAYVLSWKSTRCNIPTAMDF
jgi:hypothetical protein